MEPGKSVSSLETPIETVSSPVISDVDVSDGEEGDGLHLEEDHGQQGDDDNDQFVEGSYALVKY